jgi:hypothetical protein
LKRAAFAPKEFQEIRNTGCGSDDESKKMVCCPNRLSDELKQQPKRNKRSQNDKSMHLQEEPWIWELEEELPFWDETIPILEIKPQIEEGCPLYFPLELNETATFEPIKPVTSRPFDGLITAELAVERASKITLLNSQDCGTSLKSKEGLKIYGGEDSDPGQYRWMARLGYQDNSKFIEEPFGFDNLRLFDFFLSRKVLARSLTDVVVQLSVAVLF